MATEDEQSKAARNEMLFRSVNERISEVSADEVQPSEQVAFLCECADTECMRTMNMTLAEFEAAHASPTLFPLLPGHEWPDVERVVERHDDRYIVVEKVGEAGRKAVEGAAAD